MTPEDGFPILKALVDYRIPEQADLMLAYLRGELGHTAETVAIDLTAEGHKVSASTIRTYRRAVKAAQKGDTTE